MIHIFLTSDFMENPKISVIVPVYNAEKYLYRCVDSILAQTFEDFELLLIDDGSKDRSGEICDEYAQKDERVKVWHKENGGVSSARNVGLENARGEWVTFSDSDDWLEPNAFAYYDEMTRRYSFDYLNCGYYLNDEPELFDEEGIFCVRDFLCKNECDKLWYGLYSMSIVEKYKIRFNENITLAEDKLFNYQFLKSCRQVYCARAAFYHYSFGNTESLSFKGFDVDNFLLCHILVYQELNHIDHRKAMSEFVNSFKGIIWQSICQRRTIRQLQEMYHLVNKEISLSNVFPFKSQGLFLAYCFCQMMKFKVKSR